MRFIDYFRGDAAAEKRLLLALAASFLIHGTLIAGIGIGMAPPPGVPRTLRASIIPLSLPDAPRIDTAISEDAQRDLSPSMQFAPREPTRNADSRDAMPQYAARDTPGATGIAAELPIYYRGDEVDVRATPRKVTSTPRLERGPMLGRIVKVKLRLFISDSGEVDRFEVLEAEGLTPSLSLEDVREIPFYPAQRQGRPVRSQKVVELTFSP